MRRVGLLAVAGLILVGLAVLWGRIAGVPVLPSYLAAWLFAAALPIGSVTMLLVLEVGAGPRPPALLPAFRLMALVMPLAALLFIPVLAEMGALYPWLHGSTPGAPFGQSWLHERTFIARAIVYLLILCALALLFARPGKAGPRRTGAMLGLFVCALVGTLAAVDWVMSLDPQLHSGEFGLLILSAACAIATCVAVLLEPAPAPGAVLLLAGVSGAWLFLHFMQFLVIWSADLPHEVAWYALRDGGAGPVVEWVAFLFGFTLPVLLLALPWPMQARALAPVAGLALLAHMAEALWFVTPPLRHRETITLTDIFLLAGLGALATAAALIRPAMQRRETA